MLLVLAVKVWAGLTTQSLCLLAESYHTLIDVFSGIVSLGAVTSPYRVSGREPWGHSRRHTIGVMLISALTGFIGCTMLLIAAQQMGAVFSDGPSFISAQINPWLLQLITVAASIHFCLGLYEQYEGRLLQSYHLRIHATHILRDSWLTLLTLVALVGIWQGYHWLDPVMTIVLVLMTFPSLWRVLNWQLPSLVQQVAIAPEVLARLAGQVHGVTRCSKIQSTGIVGRLVLIEMHLAVHPDFLNMTRSIIDQLNQLLRDKFGPVQAIIQIEDDPTFRDQ